jgi:hypothetical protein
MNGHIAFATGRRLDHSNREIIRLSVTLLDHGTLQDAAFFWSLFDTLRRSKRADIKKLAAKIAQETAMIESSGHAVRKAVLCSSSLSVGQLAIVLVGVKNVEQFAKRINARATTSSTNPLLEYKRLTSQGIIS